MLFYSPVFLFLFLPMVLMAFLLFQKRKNAVLLLASLLFYGWGEPQFLPIALLSAIADYFICNKINRVRQNKKKSKFYLIVGIVLNLVLLFYYKYFNFFFAPLSSLFSFLNVAPLHLLKIALPIGVSFIVFEKITYLVDVYRGVSQPASSLQNYLTYVFLFPKLLAGPIVKFHEIASQLTHFTFRVHDFFIGFKRFLMGLIKKVLLADTLAELANTVFSLPSEQLGFYQAWLGVFCFTLQIYLDFSA